MKHLIATLALTLTATTGMAENMISYTTDQSFEDVVFGLENAIIEQGLVIDAVSHVGTMLERTRQDVGSDVVLFDQADVFSFCSAKLSREVMEADMMNIMFCPYDIFVAVRHDTPNETIVGFRAYPEGDMQKIQALLDGIARAAIGLD